MFNVLDFNSSINVMIITLCRIEEQYMNWEKEGNGGGGVGLLGVCQN